MTTLRSLAAAALLLCATDAATAQERELVERGRQDYETHCSGCHGVDGRGDGPMTDVLSIPPGDLRLIRHRSDGVFPFARLYRVIDGREEVRGHGVREMPVWGLSFAERGLDAPQADAVRGRILQLLRFLESIQVEPGSDTEGER